MRGQLCHWVCLQSMWASLPQSTGTWSAFQMCLWSKYRPFMQRREPSGLPRNEQEWDTHDPGVPLYRFGTAFAGPAHSSFQCCWAQLLFGSWTVTGTELSLNKNAFLVSQNYQRVWLPSPIFFFPKFWNAETRHNCPKSRRGNTAWRELVSLLHNSIPLLFDHDPMNDCYHKRVTVISLQLKPSQKKIQIVFRH